MHKAMFYAVLFAGPLLAESPGRDVAFQMSPATIHAVTLANPSTVAQTVTVTIDALGNEQINNRLVPGMFQYCVWTSGACSWVAPGNNALTCNNTPYKQCTLTGGSNTIAPGASLRLMFGSIINPTTCLAAGCSARELVSFSATSGIMVRIHVNGNAGHLTGDYGSADDTVDAIVIQNINGGRPF